ncbi:MAG: hypothetical protein QXF52_04665 [Thermoproteota archaeon]
MRICNGDKKYCDYVAVFFIAPCLQTLREGSRSIRRIRRKDILVHIPKICLGKSRKKLYFNNSKIVEYKGYQDIED